MRAVLAPLRRGRADPTLQITAEGTVWRTGTTPDGAATIALRRLSCGQVRATAWGPGAGWMLDGLDEDDRRRAIDRSKPINFHVNFSAFM